MTENMECCVKCSCGCEDCSVGNDIHECLLDYECSCHPINDPLTDFMKKPERFVLEKMEYEPEPVSGTLFFRDTEKKAVIPIHPDIIRIIKLMQWEEDRKILDESKP